MYVYVCLRCISESGVRRCILSEATEILSLVVEQLKNYSECEGVVTAGCGLLDALTEAGGFEQEREREVERGGGESKKK